MLWIHKGYFGVKNWCEMFVWKLSGAQMQFNELFFFYIKLHHTDNQLLTPFTYCFFSTKKCNHLYFKIYFFRSGLTSVMVIPDSCLPSLLSCSLLEPLPESLPASRYETYLSIFYILFVYQFIMSKWSIGIHFDLVCLYHHTTGMISHWSFYMKNFILFLWSRLLQTDPAL